MPEWLQALVAAVRGRQAQSPASPQPGDPMLADVLNPALSVNRRMAAEGQAVPALPDSATLAVPAAGAPRFQRQYTPEERAMQQKRLAEILARRQQ